MMFLTRHRLRQALYAPVLALAMGLMLVRLLVMARMLDVGAFADYSAALLVASAVTMAGSFGLYYKLSRSLPILLFHNNENEAAILLTQTIVGSLAVGIVALSLVPVWSSFSNLSAPLFLAGFLNGIAQQLFLVVTAVSRSRGRTLDFSIENLVRSIGIILAIVPIAALVPSAVTVVVAEAVVSAIISLAILMRTVPSALRPTLVVAKSAIRQLSSLDWGAILALLGVSVISFLSTNVDRWFALEILDKAGFAEYAFAWTIMVVALSVQAVVNASVFPFIARRYAAHGLDRAWRISAVVSFGMLLACCFVAIPGSVIASYAVPALFPKYGGAVVLVAPLAIAASFRMADFWSSFLIIAGLERFALVANIASVCVGVSGWFFWTGNDGFSAAEMAWLALIIAMLNFVFTALASLLGRDRARSG